MAARKRNRTPRSLSTRLAEPFRPRATAKEAAVQAVAALEAAPRLELKFFRKGWREHHVFGPFTLMEELPLEISEPGSDIVGFVLYVEHSRGREMLAGREADGRWALMPHLPGGGGGKTWDLRVTAYDAAAANEAED